jgi:hypothetical protein
MKQQKLLMIGLLVVAVVAFFMTRPIREKACPLVDGNDPEFAQRCLQSGGIIKDGKCTCPV